MIASNAIYPYTATLGKELFLKKIEETFER